MAKIIRGDDHPDRDRFGDSHRDAHLAPCRRTFPLHGHLIDEQIHGDDD